MKTSAFSLVVLFLAVTIAQADWVLVQNVTTDGKESVITMKIKGDQVRVDMGENTSVIVSTEGMTMIMHMQKMIMKRDMAAIKAGVEKLGKSLAGQEAAKPVATGQKEKVGEWDTEIYTWEGTMAKGRFWVAKDFPKFAEISAVQDKLGKVVGGAMSGMSPQASDLDGMVVKSEMTQMGKAVISHLVSAKEETVSPEEFVAPTGYHEMKMPGAPR